MEGAPKLPFKEKLKLLNHPETKIYKYFNKRKMKKNQITFEKYEGLFLNEKLNLLAPTSTFRFIQIKTEKIAFFRKLTTKKFLNTLTQ